jgi:hypothetical protein
MGVEPERPCGCHKLPGMQRQIDVVAADRHVSTCQCQEIVGYRLTQSAAICVTWMQRAVPDTGNGERARGRSRPPWYARVAPPVFPCSYPLPL